MKSKNNRFEVLSSEGSINNIKVLVDKQTGVNYLYCVTGYAGGLTILVDQDGKPIVTSLDVDS